MRNVNRMANTNKQQCTTNLLFGERNGISWENSLGNTGSGGIFCAHLGLKSIRRVCRSIVWECAANICRFRIGCVRASRFLGILLQNGHVIQLIFVRISQHIRSIDTWKYWLRPHVRVYRYFRFYFSSFAFTEILFEKNKTTTRKLRVIHGNSLTNCSTHTTYILTERLRWCVCVLLVLFNSPKLTISTKCRVWQIDVQLMAAYDEWCCCCHFANRERDGSTRFRVIRTRGDWQWMTGEVFRVKLE